MSAIDVRLQRTYNGLGVMGHWVYETSWPFDLTPKVASQVRLLFFLFLYNVWCEPNLNFLHHFILELHVKVTHRRAALNWPYDLDLWRDLSTSYLLHQLTVKRRFFTSSLNFLSLLSYGHTRDRHIQADRQSGAVRKQPPVGRAAYIWAGQTWILLTLDL